MAENDIVVKQTFEEKLRSRLRDSIGELMSDEDLKKLIDASMKSIFFDPRPNPKYNYNNGQPTTIEPLLHELLKELLLPNMKIALDSYLKENADMVQKTLDEILLLGVGQAYVKAMNMQFQTQLAALSSSIYSTLANQPR